MLMRYDFLWNILEKNRTTRRITGDDSKGFDGRREVLSARLDQRESLLFRGTIVRVYDGAAESRPSGRSSGFESRCVLRDSLLYDERSEFMRKDSVMTKRAKGCIRIIACAFLLAGMGLLGAYQA